MVHKLQLCVHVFRCSSISNASSLCKSFVSRVLFPFFRIVCEIHRRISISHFKGELSTWAAVNSPSFFRRESNRTKKKKWKREREGRKKARVTTKWQSRHTHTLIYGICAQVLLKENWKTANERKEQKTLDRCEKCCPSPITGDANARARTQNVSIFVSIAIFF